MAKAKKMKKPLAAKPKGAALRKRNQSLATELKSPPVANVIAQDPKPLPRTEDMATEPSLSTFANGARNYSEYVEKVTGKPGVSREVIKTLLDEQSGLKRDWVMPDNSDEAKAARSAAKVEDQRRRIFVANEDAPVTVMHKTDDGPKTVSVYQNMEDFRAQHNFTDYKFMEARSDKDQTVIMVKPMIWVGKERKVSTPRPAGSTKAEMIGAMLLRTEGVTSKEVCEAMGWPSVSMPAQAKAVGMTLKKEKIDGVTRYWGIKA